MKAAPFAWHRPASLDEAVALLAEVAPDDGRVIAGGQSLIPAMALRVARPRHLVDLNGIADLARIEQRDGRLRIGALVRHDSLAQPGVPGPLGALLREVVRHIAHWPIRTRGTLCGSCCHADPAAEWPLVTTVLGATMIARSVRGERAIPAAQFFEGLLTTALTPDEILAAVELPLLPEGARFGFVEVSRRAGDFAQAMALALLLPDGARIGVGAVEPAPRRVPEAEALFDGTHVSVASAAEAAAAAVAPMEDPAYRRALVRSSVARALAEALR